LGSFAGLKRFNSTLSGKKVLPNINVNKKWY